ncbi:uncharacterized protein BO72DRAFT_148165 [Aspergillus fijiensis CBS 313.89]|uniref:Uncharacterized protein n=1 Tax=Aspergillus fijiensis CBS 313.89 TaxID=1448319 RepID=A0A8G1W0K4_9EURO|nr:uncharacterized protein BO72DRAFT_148165 [Aspergillus fijiensis CBS 313.89]RAK76129.1 hypothetical protein BO72DRAFT_148165 [Aspergillus fijiensis CBS 313.89]
MELWHHPHHAKDSLNEAPPISHLPTIQLAFYPDCTAHPLPATTTATFADGSPPASPPPAPVMLPEKDPLSMSPSARAIGPVRRGPIRRDAVGQFVHDVPSPKPEKYCSTMFYTTGKWIRYDTLPRIESRMKPSSRWRIGTFGPLSLWSLNSPFPGPLT